MTYQNQMRTLPSQKSLLERAVEKYRKAGFTRTLRHTRIALTHRAHTAIEKIARWDTTEAHKKNGSVGATETLDERTSDETGCPYVASPWLVLKWINEALPADKSNWAFVDLGAGEGRAVLAAAKHNYKQIVGVDYDEELARIARMNIEAAIPSGVTVPEVVHADAAIYELPQSPVIVFMFNPFDPPVINRVADQIGRSYERAQRPMIIAYLNPKHTDVLANISGFSKRALNAGAALKFATLSPYELHLYATKKALPFLRNTQ